MSENLRRTKVFYKLFQLALEVFAGRIKKVFHIRGCQQLSRDQRKSAGIRGMTINGTKNYSKGPKLLEKKR